MSCIYFIKNKLDGRMYIGQTVQQLETRMKQHLKDSLEVDLDIQRLGLDKFEYGILEECNSEELDEKEIQYIAKYDTYYNGYNNQLGGRKTGKNKYDSIIEKVREDYVNGMSMIDLNIKYRIKAESLRYIVKDLEKVDINPVYTNIGKRLIGYTKDWKRICIFESIKDALRFVNEEREKEGKPLVDERNFYRTIKTACTKNGIASGYRWQYREDVLYDGMEFNSTLDRDAYIRGTECICIDELWYVNKKERISKDNIKSTCANNTEQSYKENKTHSSKITKIDKNELALIYKDYSVKEIADRYNCTVGSIRQMLKSMGLQSKRVASAVEEDTTIDIYNKIESGESYETIAEHYGVTKDVIRMRYNRYLKKQGIIKEDTRAIGGTTCIELDVSFSTLKEAALFLTENKIIYSTNIKSISFKIGKAIKENKEFKGLHWVKYDNNVKEYNTLNSEEKDKVLRMAYNIIYKIEA